MGHNIEYVIKIPGAGFNELLDPRDKMTSAQIQSLKPEGTFLECKLEASKMQFLAEISPELTLISLPYHYALLFSDEYQKETEEIVEEWETTLKTVLPTVPIIRVSESLLNDWRATQPEQWLRDANKFEELHAWLEGQEDDLPHWQRVQ